MSGRDRVSFIGGLVQARGLLVRCAIGDSGGGGLDSDEARRIVGLVNEILDGATKLPPGTLLAEFDVRTLKRVIAARVAGADRLILLHGVEIAVERYRGPLDLGPVDLACAERRTKIARRAAVGLLYHNSSSAEDTVGFLRAQVRAL